MYIKLLKKDKMENFLQNIARENTVFVPDKMDGLVTFREFKRKEFLLFPYSNFYIPPVKCFLFPSSIKKYLDCPFDENWIKPGKKVLLGVRPCDAQSLVLLDKAIEDFDFYREKRDNILLIVQGCNSPRNTCFCTSVNGDPFSVSGADVFITDIGDYFVMEDISGRAAEYLSNISDAGSEELYEKEKIAFRSNEMIDVILNLSNLPEKLETMEEKFEGEGIWQKLAKKCTNCTKCTSLCPTCHCCFAVEDMVEMVCDELGDKAKDFDCCKLNIIISSGFSNTTPRAHDRLKRRLMDKFCRNIKIIGQPLCVGCGRCVISCEKNINIIDILKLLTESDFADKKNDTIQINL